MRVLAYGKCSVENVLAVVESVFSKENVEVCGDLQSLSARLREPLEEDVVVLLVPANPDDFQEILSIRHLLENVRTIVVAPNQETDVVAMAHTLRPRFLTYAGEDLRTLTSVLYKMTSGRNSDGMQERRSRPRG